MKTAASFGSILTHFFTQRLMGQRHVSPHTLCCYRDTFRLLLKFIHAQTGKQPSSLMWVDVDAALIGAFLDDLEQHRGISARSRNLRLTAIRSLFRFAAFELPEHFNQIQRVLAIPPKRVTHHQIGYLSRSEQDMLLSVPDRSIWAGRRDHAWMLLATQTGLRLSELTGLVRSDIHLGPGAYVHVVGKGRKERCTPLTSQMSEVLRMWLAELPAGETQVVFPSRRGVHMSNDGIQYLLARHVETARKSFVSLRNKRVSPHVLRHAAAMNLLQAGVDTAVIAMWLGHESVETTRVYLEADLEMKRNMLAKTSPAGSTTSSPYRPGDALLAFLQAL